MAVNKTDEQKLELLSVYVLASHRRRGIASQLLQQLMHEARLCGAREIVSTYMTQQAFTPAIESMFRTSGWSPPETRMLVVTATLVSIRPAPWIKEYKLPDRMRLVPWIDLEPLQLDDLRLNTSQHSWIPKDLYPFDFEAGFEPQTSVALLEGDHIAGWVINHLVNGRLRFSCSYMRPDMQRRGRILILYNYAVSRMPLLGVDCGIWTIPIHHNSMVEFARRWMAPYATEFSETRGCRYQLLT